MAFAVQQTGFRRVKRGYKPLKVEALVPGIKPAEDPTDPYFPLQWYLKNTGQNGGKVKLDLNVEAAWAQGVTGKNVTTAIMDDGEYIENNFNRQSPPHRRFEKKNSLSFQLVGFEIKDRNV